MAVSQISSGATAIFANDFNARIKAILKRKAESITKNEPLRQALGEIYLQRVNKYVPKKTGYLRDSASVTTRGRVMWSAVKRGYNYADIQYVTQYKHYTTAGTGPYWTDKIHPENGPDEWRKFVNSRTVRALILEAYKNG